MIKVYFSSLEEPKSLQERIVEVLDELVTLSSDKTVVVDIMLFSFTDTRIAQKIMQIATNCDNVKFRILADYSNISTNDSRKIRSLEVLQLPNLQVKLKIDFPYKWNERRAVFEWSYAESIGFLHHKTMLVKIDGQPTTLVTGSYNWTKKSNESYENLLIVSLKNEYATIGKAFDREFASIWDNTELSTSTSKAIEVFDFVVNNFKKGIHIKPLSVYEAYHKMKTSVGNTNKKRRIKTLCTEHTLVAFSAKHPFTNVLYNGYSTDNHFRAFLMQKNVNDEKKAPLSITNLSLDFIQNCSKGDVLKIAMFALSKRVPEYGAILNAARRGVRVVLILDKKLGAKTASAFQEKNDLETLRISIKLSNRMMHQKYLVNLNKNAVLTGTANMTLDSSMRHAEHRFLFRDDVKLANRFSKNFDDIWSRLK